MKRQRSTDNIRNNTRLIKIKKNKNILFIPITLMKQNFLEKYNVKT